MWFGLISEKSNNHKYSYSPGEPFDENLHGAFGKRDSQKFRKYFKYTC